MGFYSISNTTFSFLQNYPVSYGNKKRVAEANHELIELKQCVSCITNFQKIPSDSVSEGIHYYYSA